MKDEIKEILEKLKSNNYPFGIATIDINKLENYITNLRTIEQQYSALLSEYAELENKITNLQEENERLNNVFNELEKELREGSFDVYFCSTTSQKTFKSNEIIIKAMILDKLKELKEGKE